VGGPDLKLIALGTVNDVGLFRDLLSAGANDYLVKPPSREALTGSLEKGHPGGGAGGLGEVLAFIGTRGGVGTTTAAVSCAWLLAEQHRARTALVDLDLHFGTVALNLDTDPGSGLCEALEQPSRIDGLFVERAMVKVSDTLRVLAAEAAINETPAVDGGAIDVLLYELRRRFTCVILAAAGKVVLMCERSLAGLRDTIRLQTLVREHAPQTRLILVETGAPGERAMVGKGEFEKAVGKPLDATFSYDPKAASAATNSGQPLPQAAPRSAVAKEFQQFVASLSGPPAAQKRRLFGGLRLW